MRRAALAILLVSVSMSGSAGEKTRISLLADRVTFSVPTSWVELPRQTTEQSDIIGFQILNPADEGSSDSANAVVVALQNEPPLDLSGFSGPILAKLQNYPGTVIVNDHTGESGVRTVLSRSQQGDTPYVVLDQFAVRADVRLHFRVAYPLLESAPGWSEQLMDHINETTQSLAIDDSAVFPKVAPPSE